MLNSAPLSVRINEEWAIGFNEIVDFAPFVTGTRQSVSSLLVAFIVITACMYVANVALDAIAHEVSLLERFLEHLYRVIYTKRFFRSRR